MKYKRRRIFALLAALVMVLLAGCGGGRGNDVQKPDAPAPSEEVTPARPDAAEPETAPAAPTEAQPEVQEPADSQQANNEPAEIQPEETPEAEPAAKPEADPEPEPEPEPSDTVPEDGTYTANVTLEGGSGRAKVASPATLRCENGQFWATITWSSPNFDYMKVDGEKYLPTNTEGNSTFELPVAAFDQKLDVIADTVAMSEPHEVEYTLTFDSASLTRQ